MSTRYRRPVGAHADTAELEYCAALRQTEPHSLRADGRISVEDIQLHLISRHGVPTSESQVVEHIMVALAGCVLVSSSPSDQQQELVDEESAVLHNDDQNKDTRPKDSNMEQTRNPTWQTTSEVESSSSSIEVMLDLVQQTALLLIPALQRIRVETHQRQSQADGDRSSTVADDTVNGPLLLIAAVLKVILNQAGLLDGVIVDRQILKSILKVYGEDPDHLGNHVLDDMIEVCRKGGTINEDMTSSDVAAPILDATALLRALTCDTELYDIQREDMAEIHYRDALDSSPNGTGSIARMMTGASIDTTADTLRSMWWTILTWFAVVTVFFAYFTNGLKVRTTAAGGVSCSALTKFGCITANSVIIWIEVFLVLSVLGTVFISGTSMGNGSYPGQRKWMTGLSQLGGLTMVVFSMILSYFFHVRTPIFSTEKTGRPAIYITVLVVGLLLVLNQLGQLIRLFVPVEQLRFRAIFAAGGPRLERWTKLAATHKTERILLHALQCHCPVSMDDEDDKVLDTAQQIQAHCTALLQSDRDMSNHMAKCLHAYTLQADDWDMVGGIGWTWQKLLFDHVLFSQEGIWMFPRLIASNMVQWCIVCLIPYAAVLLDEYAKNNIGDNSFISLRRIRICISLGALGAAAAVLTLALTFVPSYISAVLRFRSGLLGSLRDDHFLIYRYAPDQVTITFGSAFWGAIFTGVSCWSLVFVVALLAIWDITRPLFLNVMAGILGYLITMLLRFFVMRFLRFRWHGAFYRRKPLQSNLLNVVLETWNLGLTTGYIVARTVKLLLLAVFFVGRIDAEFLSPYANLLFGKWPLDSYPVAFKKDLLIHEAHRHPYMERFALLYLLKLHHEQNFGRQACAIWRILFVKALMPWLAKHRRPTALAESGGSDFLHGMDLQTELRLLREENARLRKQVREYEERTSVSFRKKRGSSLLSRNSASGNPTKRQSWAAAAARQTSTNRLGRSLPLWPLQRLSTTRLSAVDRRRSAVEIPSSECLGWPSQFQSTTIDRRRSAAEIHPADHVSPSQTMSTTMAEI